MGRKPLIVIFETKMLQNELFLHLAKEYVIGKLIDVVVAVGNSSHLNRQSVN